MGLLIRGFESHPLRQTPTLRLLGYRPFCTGAGGIGIDRALARDPEEFGVPGGGHPSASAHALGAARPDHALAPWLAKPG